jgi:[acyl-carrier-protein] S-malonyltransferase
MTRALKWAAVFSGQGGQRMVHVRRLRSALPDDLRSAWTAALALAGVRSADLDDATLTNNRVAQPTLCAWQVGAWDALATALPPPVLVAGYSVGELAACCAAGGFSGAQAIELAARRALLMDAVTQAPAGLAATVGLAESDIHSLCQRAGVEVAIRNGPRHFVVGGPIPALDMFIAAALDAGAVRAQRLPVAVPAHTRWLADAATQFAAALSPVLADSLCLPMLSGIDAHTLRTAADAAAALARQIASPLDWAACMEAIAEAQPDAVLEIGPGDALARMFAESVPEVPARSLDDFRDPAGAIAWLRRQQHAF